MFRPTSIAMTRRMDLAYRQISLRIHLFDRDDFIGHRIPVFPKPLLRSIYQVSWATATTTRTRAIRFFCPSLVYLVPSIWKFRISNRILFRRNFSRVSLKIEDFSRRFTRRCLSEVKMTR